jgi:hypothetical protein
VKRDLTASTALTACLGAGPTGHAIGFCCCAPRRVRRIYATCGCDTNGTSSCQTAQTIRASLFATATVALCRPRCVAIEAAHCCSRVSRSGARAASCKATRNTARRRASGDSGDGHPRGPPWISDSVGSKSERGGDSRGFDGPDRGSVGAMLGFTLRPYQAAATAGVSFLSRPFRHGETP